MSKGKFIVVPLSIDDELLVTLNFDEGNRLAEANVQYRARIDGEWREVCRYDNAHGPPHVHRFWEDSAERPLPKNLSRRVSSREPNET